MQTMRWVFMGSFALVALLPLPAANVPPTAAGWSAFPAPGARDLPIDAPLRLTFPGAVALGETGTIQIGDLASGAVVETIDLAARTATKTIGGLPDFNYRPVIVAGNTAAIFPRALAGYGRTYFVRFGAGVFVVAGNKVPALDGNDRWQFTTRAAPPAAGATRLTVAADGTGDFCTVQGALDFIPAGNVTPTTIFVRRGTYEEIICFTDKHAITLFGEDREQTIISYANNANFNASGGNPYAGGANPSAALPARRDSIYRRGVLLAHRVEDLVIANLTIRNTTPRGGSQAEAIILNGTTTARAIITRVDLYSFQDTLQINGQAYVSDCLIEGDVDFMWGTGPTFFENCIARTTRSDAYFTQVRNPATNHGFVYLRCTFEGLPGITGNFLSRIQPSRFPHSEVVLLDCVVTDCVAPVGWQLQAGPNGEAGDPARLHFWEFRSRDARGAPVDVTARLAASRQLTLPGDTALVRDYSDPAFVLGHNWNPRSAAPAP